MGKKLQTSAKPNEFANPKPDHRPPFEDEAGFFTGGGLFEAALPQDTLFVGYDEAGRGALAGPVSVAAFCFSPHMLERVRQRRRLTRLDDSKNMSPPHRNRYRRWLPRLAVASSVQLRSAAEIDRLGINVAIEEAMAAAWHDCLMQNPALLNHPVVHLLDGNYRFKSEAWLKIGRSSLAVRSVVKGDSRLASIAAASVLAKVSRDDVMVDLHMQYPGFGFDGHKGYATAAHLAALTAGQPSAVHRFSYQPLKGRYPQGREL